MPDKQKKGRGYAIPVGFLSLVVAVIALGVDIGAWLVPRESTSSSNTSDSSETDTGKGTLPEVTEEPSQKPKDSQTPEDSSSDDDYRDDTIPKESEDEQSSSGEGETVPSLPPSVPPPKESLTSDLLQGLDCELELRFGVLEVNHRSRYAYEGKSATQKRSLRLEELNKLRPIRCSQSTRDAFKAYKAYEKKGPEFEGVFNPFDKAELFRQGLSMAAERSEYLSPLEPDEELVRQIESVQSEYLQCKLNEYQEWHELVKDTKQFAELNGAVTLYYDDGTSSSFSTVSEYCSSG